MIRRDRDVAGDGVSPSHREGTRLRRGHPLVTAKNIIHYGSQYTLRFSGKCGKSRENPVRHELERLRLGYVQVAVSLKGHSSAPRTARRSCWPRMQGAGSMSAG